MKPQLHVKLFGSPQFTYKDKPLAGFLTNKTRALLIYLAVTGRTHSRDMLAELLWADTPATKRNNLKKALNNLRKMEGVELVEEGYLNVTLAPDSFQLDINEFSTLAGQEPLQNITTIERAVALYQDDFLIGFNLSLSLEFEEWALGIQSHLKMQMLELLHQLVDGYEQQNLHPKAITTLRRILQIEPWQEESHRRLIALLAQNGDASAALAQYEICCQNLRTELDVEPSSATTDLVEQIQNGTFVPKPPPKKAYQLAKSAPNPSVTRLTTKVEYPLVGREGEWQIIRAVWQSLGQSHFICIGGEAGIGKTRLAEELLLLAESQNASVARSRSHELQGQLAFGPITDWLRSAPLQLALGQLDDGWRVEISRLLPELLSDGMLPPQPMQEGWQRKRFFDALVHAFTMVNGPLLLVLDDLQWSDTDTLEWIQYLVESRDEPILIVATVRLNEIDTEHPLHRLRHQLRRQDKFTEVQLSELTVEATSRLAATVREANLEDQFAQQLFKDTSGNPLFVIESMRVGPDGSVVTEPSFSVDSQPESGNQSVSIPAKIYSVIQARLARLSPQAQQLAQLGAAVGRAFDARLLAMAAKSNENEVLVLLDELWQKRIIKEIDVVHFDFSHDRIRDVAYAEIGAIKRRILHRSVADAIKKIYQNRLDDVCSQLATHYEYAGEVELAIDYYQQAASIASGLNAYREKIKYLTSGINLIRQLSHRAHFMIQELSMLREQSDAYVAIEGFASSAAINISHQMLELAIDAQNDEARYHAFRGLRVAYAAQGRLYEAREYAIRALEVAKMLTENDKVANAHNNLAAVYFHTGALCKAWPHFEQALTLDHPNAFSRSPHARWLLGYPDEAREISLKGISMIRSQGDAYQNSWSLLFTAMLDFLVRDFASMKVHYEEAQLLNRKYDFAFISAHVHFFEGWSMAINGEKREAINLFEQGVAARLKLDNNLFQPFWNVLMIEAYRRLGEFNDACTLAKRTLNEAQSSDEGFLNAELYRILGDLELSQFESKAVAERHYWKAIHIAREQSAKSLELRATISLYNLWITQSKIVQADQLLSTIYEQFTEGFATKDLREAEALLYSSHSGY